MENLEKSISCIDSKKSTATFKLNRCVEWIQNQNDPEKLSLENKNDIKFIMETNAHRKKFLLSAAEDEATVPAGVDEPASEPQVVPIKRLRVENLRMECEWLSCKSHFSNYEEFQKHVANHNSELIFVIKEGKANYVCLWDICDHSTSDYSEIVRHINYHAYHAHLLAIGFNARATLKLERCNKDSKQRNTLPPLKSDHFCMWVGCSESFNSIQTFFYHVKCHINFTETYLCSWGGCGAVFPRRTLLTTHVRSHTKERLIACYHCGHHFACNGKLSDHLLRQNVHPGTGIPCGMCGALCATEYLKREHERQHVSAYACTMCDMSAPTPTTLANHVRYRHLSSSDTRLHACPHCPYRAVTKSDLKKHIRIHTRKIKRKRKKQSDEEDEELSGEESSENERKKRNVVKKKYACHMCPEKAVKVFSRGTRLTTHLVKVHGAQWPFGHSRFRYQISDDGMYRLTTTRFEYEDISRKIVDGYSGPKKSLNNTYEFDLKQMAEATETSPKRFEIILKNNEDEEDKPSEKNKAKDGEKRENNKIDINQVEIMMCDVDEDGNIINTETIQSCEPLFSK